MAYGNNKYTGNSNRTQAAAVGRPAGAVVADRPKAETLFATGLFTPKGDNVQSVGTVQMTESVTIPAGSYLNLYANEAGAKTATGKDAPPFKLIIKAGVLKPKQ